MDHKMHEVAKSIPHQVQTRETDQGLFVMETWEINRPLPPPTPQYNKSMAYQLKIQIIEIKQMNPIFLVSDKWQSSLMGLMFHG